jgi:hypothetical protein
MFRRAHQERQKQLNSLTPIEKISYISSISQVEDMMAKMKQEPYEECLMALANMTGQSHDNLKQQFDTERTLTQSILKQTDPFIFHDPNIPATLYTQLKNIYEQDGDNLNSTTLKYVKNSDNKQLLASARGIIFGLFRKPPRIILQSILLERPENDIFFTLMHEKHHILLQHSSMTLVAFPHSSANSPMRKFLLSAQEREADIYAASKNSKLAYQGVLHACAFGHTDIIDNKSHCAQMQTMFALTLQKEKLLKLQSDSLS